MQAPVVFACSACGECCTSVRMPIDTYRAEYLAEQPWFRKRLADYDARLSRGDDDGEWILPLKPDRSCVFLAGDKRCLIEANAGKDWKPLECRRFPFASVRYAGETLYDVSAACRTVSGELLGLLAPVVPAPGTFPDPDAEPQTLPESLRFGRFRRVSTRRWLAPAPALRAIGDSDADPLVTLRLINRALPGLLQEKEPLKALPSAAWQRWLWRSLPFWFARNPYGLWTRWQLLRGRQLDDPLVFGATVTLPAPGQAALAPAANRLINAFAVNILQRRVVLAHDMPIANLLLMATIAASLTAWHARILAVQQGLAETGVAETRLAIRLVERYYTGHQPRFLAEMRRGGWPVALCRLLLA